MDRLKLALAYIAARLREGSTWAGIGSLLTGMGMVIAPDQWQAIMATGMGIGGFLAIVLADPKKPGE